jgi:hypothetical protein
MDQSPARVLWLQRFDVSGRTWRLAFAALATSWLVGCALPVPQHKLEQPIAPASGRQFILDVDADCYIGTGYGRTLRQGTRWRLYGTIPQGDVYRSPDQTLTVEGYNVHEAYPVIHDDAVVGFYLPVEHTFTETSKPVPLTLTKTPGDQP